MDVDAVEQRSGYFRALALDRQRRADTFLLGIGKKSADAGLRSQFKSPKYPKQLNTLGEHIRTRRLDLELLQKQVAAQVGVDTTTIWNWQSNATSPQVHDMPRIIEFLGYNPLPVPELFGEQILSVRKALGLIQRAMSKQLGVDSTTLARWENGERRPSRKFLMVFQGFLDRTMCDMEVDSSVVQTLAQVLRRSKA
jgi:transcriptional regulator with XRE-family HTH domain